MLTLHRRSSLTNRVRCVTAGISAVLLSSTSLSTLAQAQTGQPTTPIKHVIVIIGENRSFDHVFATYQPVNKGESVLNLLSEKIVNPDGTPGPNYGRVLQRQAVDTHEYNLSPPSTPYSVLPPALTGGASTPYLCQTLGITSGTSCLTPANLAVAPAYENGLAPDYYQYLLTGGTGQPSKVPDARINYDGHDASHLPGGPYQLTSKTYPYDAYAASPVHRFYQMRQQLDCDAAAADQSNGWGCASDLYAWVEVTIGAGSNGKAPPSPFTNESTGEGSTALGFYNVQQGDVPYFKLLADTYSMSDNYHQAFAGGTGANHIMMGTGDAIWFSDGNGNPLTPPNNGVNPTMPGTPLSGKTSALTEIENPDPFPGTNNYYSQDGYGGGSGSPTATPPNANYGGGSYIGCGDPSQPGVSAVLNYLGALPSPVASRCDKGYYYLVNNYNPGYLGDGTNAYTDTNSANTVFTIPPSSVRTIGDLLIDNGVSWVYFGDGWNAYVSNPYAYQPGEEYCNICNFEQYATSIMTNPTYRTNYLADTATLYAGIQSGNLPAVSFVKPSGLVDGHPSSSKLILFEGFVKKIVDGVTANPTLWANTAILITFDEGGGYWDSGYVQPLDFFGDGTRIPMIAVSKYSTGGHISHTYADHLTVDKFIEANWGLPPITGRSRDNLPNPVTQSNPYIPVNSPAIGDLMDLFNFN
jgi:phospholipase C